VTVGKLKKEGQRTVRVVLESNCKIISDEKEEKRMKSNV
jgi:hypothetical protein